MRISISIGSAYYNGEEWDSLVDYTMAADRMGVDAGRHRANDRQLVRDPCCVGQQFTEIQSWHGGANRFEIAAQFDGGVRFRIESLVLRRTAAEEENDA